MLSTRLTAQSSSTGFKPTRKSKSWPNRTSRIPITRSNFTTRLTRTNKSPCPKSLASLTFISPISSRNKASSFVLNKNLILNMDSKVAKVYHSPGLLERHRFHQKISGRRLNRQAVAHRTGPLADLSPRDAIHSLFQIRHIGAKYGPPSGPSFSDTRQAGKFTNTR